jgi:eukaryotic-like serine/threonine-protein kinase
MTGRTIKLQAHEWTLGEQVGGGGFGAVYAATAPEVEQSAVVKLVPKVPGAQRELLFVDASDARNVIPVLDVGEDEASYGLAMARAEKSLRQHLNEQGQLNETEALGVLRDIAAALEDLDGRLVHRDLKPENVLYLNGFWNLADFGISRYAEATTAEDTRKYSMTAQYAAPEQWRFEQATGAADVYALGVMGFEMLAGRRPFLGPDFRNQHLHEAPPPLDGVAGPLAALIAQCLNKDPGSRPSAADISVRLTSMAGKTVRPGLAGLQQAHHDAVLQTAESQRQLSEVESWHERRGRLFDDASRSLTAIAEELKAALTEAAPSMRVVPRTNELLVLQFGDATLNISEPRQVQGSQKEHRMPFKVIAFAEIALLAAGQYGYQGRAHSLWYSDLEEEDRFSWYELGFMTNALMAQQTAVAPFSQSPLEGAGAILPGVGTKQLAWTPTKLVPGDIEEFIVRWGQWMTKAYSGPWMHPTQLPEHPVERNWRGA